jgi:hypothetical protein
MNAIAFTREERALARVSKDGHTHCAEHHPSRRAKNGAHLRMTVPVCPTLRWGDGVAEPCFLQIALQLM